MKYFMNKDKIAHKRRLLLVPTIQLMRDCILDAFVALSKKDFPKHHLSPKRNGSKQSLSQERYFRNVKESCILVIRLSR